MHTITTFKISRAHTVHLYFALVRTVIIDSPKVGCLKTGTGGALTRIMTWLWVCCIAVVQSATSIPLKLLNDALML